MHMMIGGICILIAIREKCASTTADTKARAVTVHVATVATSANAADTKVLPGTNPWAEAVKRFYHFYTKRA